MPSQIRKKRAGSDIRKWCTKSPQCSSTPPGGAAASQKPESPSRTVKVDPDGGRMDGHSHNFKVQFGPNDQQKFAIHCDHPCTVLDAIKSIEASTKKLACSDQNLIIQLGSEDQEVTVATHFPCSCVSEGQLVIVSQQKRQVEEAGVQRQDPVLPEDEYYIFYVDTGGGLHTKKKKLFINPKIKEFKYVMIYTERGTTVKEAIKQDGRFIKNLGNFKLTDIEDKCLVECTQKVDGLHRKKFKLRLPKRKSDDSGSSAGFKLAIALAEQRGVSVNTKAQKPDDEVDQQQIYELLRQQFPDLRKWMESRFTAENYRREMDLRKEHFGKIQQSFSEVYRVEKLFGLAKSVCKISVEGICTGTGFVLVDNFIMTNAHLFQGHVENQTLDEAIKVYAFFHYDIPEPKADYIFFSAKNTFVEFDLGLDYAVLELDPVGEKCKPQSKKSTDVPPGLLQKFGPLPKSGEVCLFGHPKGKVKQMDPTWIIEKESREKAVEKHLLPHMGNLFTLLSIKCHLSGRGIEDILEGGSQADGVGTYSTFMYHGASGSPVFDGLGRVCGIHTSGFTYGFVVENYVIECAQPTLTIFENLVGKLRASGDDTLLSRIEQEAEKNSHLKKILHQDLEELMDQS